MSLSVAEAETKRRIRRLGLVLGLAVLMAGCGGSSAPWWDTQYDYREGSNVSAWNSRSATAPRPRGRPDSYVRTASATPAARPRSAASGGTHVVKAGETVYRISKMYGVEQDALRSANGIGSDNAINAGQRLTIPGRGEVQVASGAPTPRVKPPLDAPPPATGQFIWPAEGRIVSRFGPKADGLHNDGINIAVPEGTPVRAAQSGVVAYAGNELRGYGNLLLIRHADGWMTAYAHNGKLLVERGATVTKGQTIALAGRTGSVQTAQVHFEIRRGARAMDPLKVMSG
ncbi:MAG: M23 family metallopeptidase [Parvibaculaceae bacterium]